MTNEAKEIYKLGFRLGQVVDLIIGIGFLVLGFTFFEISDGFEFFSILGTILSILGLISIVLFLNYFGNSLTKRIEVDFHKEEITISSNFQDKRFEFESIEALEIYEFFDFERFSYGYSYAKYFTKKGDVFTINSLMCNSYFCPQKVKPLFVESMFPFINLSNKRKKASRKYETENLMDTYSTYKTEQLEEIVNSKGYRKEAKLAARIVLRKRNKSA